MLVKITEFKAYRTQNLTTLKGNISSYLPPLFPYVVQFGYIGAPTLGYQLLILSGPPIPPFTKFDVEFTGYEGFDRVFVEASVQHITLDRKEVDVSYGV